MTPAQVAAALKRLGRYRVGRAHEIAAQHNDGIGGHHFLALGMREAGPFTHWNIEGGARWNGSAWVKEWDPTKMDVGAFQISRKYHGAQLERMPGVAVATWKPVVAGRTANDGGYAPRWAEQLAFTDRELRSNRAYGIAAGVATADLVHFALTAHNAGKGGALQGYRDGDLDRYSTYGDYGATCLRYARVIKSWVDAHPAWRTSR